MKQLTLPLGWHDDSRGSSPGPTLTRWGFPRLGGALRAMLTDAPLPSVIPPWRKGPQMTFSGPSWRSPPLEFSAWRPASILPADSEHWRTLHITSACHASVLVPLFDAPAPPSGEMSRLSFADGDLLAGAFYRDLYCVAKPKSHS